MLGGLIIVFAAGVVLFDGWLKVAWALVLGMLLTTLIVFWLIGGDITSLTWVRGAAGEQWTEEVLLDLPDGWHVLHDVPDGRRNWDHVAIGPGGVFAIDTKWYSAPAKVENDMLRSGGIRTPGSAFRGSAFRLKEMLERECGVSTWVQAVVVIWGGFPQGFVEREKVIYIDATRLADRLQATRERLTQDEVSHLAACLQRLARPPADRP